MTEMGTTSIGHLLESSRQWPLLTAAQEVALARDIERGDLAAKERLINSNIRLVVSISRRYVGLGLSQEDLVQEGMLGLMRAAEKFDWRRGFRFSTYATAWIRQSIQRGLDHHGRTVRLPIQISQLARKLANARSRLSAQLGHEPTDAQLAAAAGIEVELLERVADLDRAATSLDAPVGPDQSVSLGELIEAPAPSPEHSDCSRMTPFLERLPPLERVVVELRYGHNDSGHAHTRSEASGAAGVSLRRIDQLERQALERLAADPGVRALSEVA